MKLRARCFVTLFLLCAPAADAQDHLQPERSALSDGGFYFGFYRSLVAKTFSDGWGVHSLVRMVTVPSFSPEWMIGVGQRDEARYIFGLEPEVDLWSVHLLTQLEDSLPAATGGERIWQEEQIARLKEYLPADLENLSVSRCEYEIQPAFADQILLVWEKMLLLTRAGLGTAFTTDGTSYHFSAFSASLGTWVSGRTHSPEGNDPARLVQIGHTMKNLCESGGEELAAQLSTQVDEILERLE